MPSLVLPPLYAILDPAQTKERAPEAVLRELLEGGAAILQLRVKTMAPSDFFQRAQRPGAATRTHGCKLIVNDRVDIALACHADGVHLGQEDLPLLVGRRLMGAKLVGISPPALEQAQEAERNGADYIGFGPMFGTTTKDTGYAARGVDMLRKIRAAVRLPIVAIGGINEQNVQQVWQAGADSAAPLRHTLRAAEIQR